MNDDELSPEEAAAAQTERTRSTAQSAAADLARMGIDPRALGLQPGVRPSASEQRNVGRAIPPAPAVDPDNHNVVPLRPLDAAHQAFPASGTSAAWAAEPPPLAQSGAGAFTGTLPLDHLIGRSPGAPSPGTPMSHLARAVTFGMMTPDAADAAEREREMVSRVRTRQTDQRVVVFLAGQGGVGTTSVAVGVGSVLAALRDDATALVSLRAGTPSLGLALAGLRAPHAREVARTDAEVAPLRLNNGLYVVDGPRWGTPVRRADVPPILDRLGQLSTFALVDVGNDPSESGHSVLSRADQVVIVTGAGADGIEGARVAAERAAEVDPYLLDSAIYVVVCRRDSALKGVVKAMRETMPAGGRVVAVPPELTLAEGEAFDPGRVSLSTRLAMIDVAGMVGLGSVARGGR